MKIHAITMPMLFTTTRSSAYVKLVQKSTPASVDKAAWASTGKQFAGSIRQVGKEIESGNRKK